MPPLAGAGATSVAVFIFFHRRLYLRVTPWSVQLSTNSMAVRQHSLPVTPQAIYRSSQLFDEEENEAGY